MTNTAANAVVGKPQVAGGIFVADLGTVLPTDESTQLEAGYESPGYLGDSGFTRTESIDSETKKAWGGDPLVVITKGIDYTAKFALAEYLNPLTQKLIYGDGNVEVTAATSESGAKLAWSGTQSPSPHKVWVAQLFSGSAVGRVVFPDGQITGREDLAYTDEDLAVRGVTLTLFADSAGKYFYEYWNDGRKLLA